MAKSHHVLYCTEDENNVTFTYFHKPLVYSENAADKCVLEAAGINLSLCKALPELQFDDKVELLDVLQACSETKLSMKSESQYETYYEKNDIRLVLVGGQKINENDFQDGMHSRKVFVKLDSPFAHEYPEGFYDSSLIAQLAKMEHPEAVTFRLQSSVDLYDMCEESSYKADSFQLVWSEKSRLWETLSQVWLTLHDDSVLEKGSFALHIGKIQLQMSQEGVDCIRNKIPRDVVHQVQSRVESLELGTFSDLKIYCKSPTGKQDVIQAHRVMLVAKSNVFARMLHNLPTGSDGSEIEVFFTKSCMELVLHYMYYGNKTKIMDASFVVILEVIQAAHVYNLKDLVRFAVDSFIQVPKKPNWFHLKGAMQMWSLSKKDLDEDIAAVLRKKTLKLIQSSSREEKKSCSEYQTLEQLAESCGPAFVIMLEEYIEPHDLTTVECKIENLQEINTKNIKTEDAKVLYELLKLGPDAMITPRSLDVGIALVLLADVCGENASGSVMKLYTWYTSEEDCTGRSSDRNILEVNYFAELFHLAALKTRTFWKNMTKIAAKKMYQRIHVLDEEALQKCNHYTKLLEHPILADKLFKVRDGLSNEQWYGSRRRRSTYFLSSN